ncbi:MAG: Protein archease [Candidatus Thorarchaeota archaeon]|nr:MAG: Protein archease [Candidatus Thorarchaeota archaeon]
MSRGFRFHEHTADITIECWGPTFEDAFEEAGHAIYEVIVDTSTVEPQESVEIEVDGIDMQELLVEWGGQLIALMEIEEQFYSKFEVAKLKETSDGYYLKGRIWGESIDLEKHDTRTEVKAMTYADMKIEEGPHKIELWFTLDL